MTTTNPTDPNQVRVTGENSFIRLSQEDGGPLTTRVSHWRVLLSPGGPGHVLFAKSEAIDDEVRIYSDNIAMARWLQEEIESMLFPEFADQSLPVIDALFEKRGDGISFWTEIVESEEDSIILTWHDFVEPFMVAATVGVIPGRTHGVYSCFLPARRAQITINGLVPGGSVFPSMRGDRVSSTACVAWSETWVRPY
ncbi:MAG: hypothetical protein QF714_13600 [Dehalococcoidia bacterium]|jgi:hypothetical protein|nr:hypothetical protein [Dehalococcoidia bacterium]MDP6228718.1 hypothetical protein [Dehalococcoidia bacterium]MDP7083822.1 hypothetical protein [Dehalococcoidia bacterium]MDP7201073.1 hypothetical protein [Dehalococcoidia bacterium]MDP7510659.1 hypothetical protein [Dehalococcoidia bacterium]